MPTFDSTGSRLLQQSPSLTGFLMENRHRPSFDGKDDDDGNEWKTPAILAADDLMDTKIKKDNDFAEEFSLELPTMPPYASLMSASMPASMPMLNDDDDRDLAHIDDSKRLEYAPSIEPMRPPGRRMVGSLERPPDVSPGAFAVPSRNTATSRTSSIPIWLYDSSRGLSNEETKQEERSSHAGVVDAIAPGRDLYAVEAQLVLEEVADAQPIPEESMNAKVPSVRMKWYQRPLYRCILVGSVVFACVLLGAVIVLVVVLSRQPAAASSSSSLLPLTPAPITAPPSPAPTTQPPSPAPSSASTSEPAVVPPTPAPIIEPPVAPPTPGPNTTTPRPTPKPSSSLTPAQIACQFLSIPNVTECLATVEFAGAPTGSTIPSEIGLLTQLTYLDFYSERLTARIPSEIGRLTQLAYLDFSANSLTSRIPSEIGLLTKLTGLFFSDNQLSGTIPSSLCSHAYLSPFIDCGEITCQAGCCKDWYSGSSCG